MAIELELDGSQFSKELIESKIKEKVEFIKSVEVIKDAKSQELNGLKKNFLTLKGTIS